MTRSPDVSVIVPVSERPSPLDHIYEEHASVLRGAGHSFEFLFVIEPSRMELSAPLRSLVERGEPIRIFAVGQGVGEAGMLQAALGMARADILLTLTPYPRIRPEGILTLLEAVREGADMATARRLGLRSSMLNTLQRKFFHLLVRRGVGGNFEDVASGVRVLRREVLEQVPLYGDLSRFLPVLAERDGFLVREVPLSQHPDDIPTRVYAPGVYLRRLIDILGVFFLIRFTRKPLRFFGLMGFTLSAIGFLILFWITVERVGGRAAADRPILLLGVLLLVLGVQAIALGLIGEIVVHLSAGENRRGYRTREVSGGAIPSTQRIEPSTGSPDDSRDRGVPWTSR